MTRTRAFLSGVAVAISALALAVAVLAWGAPDASALSVLARLAGPFAPHLVAFGIVCSAFAATFGARRSGFVLLAVALLAFANGLWRHLDLTEPLARQATPDLSVLFFNAQRDNALDPAEIWAAARAQGADVVVFAEAGALAPLAPEMGADFAFVSPCPPEACELLVATRRPVKRFWRLALNPAWPERYAVLELETADGGSVFVASVHLLKPWMSGLAESERALLGAQLSWLPGPSVVVGDFNMTPWDQPLRALLRETGFRALRAQPGSWPASAGGLGLPIDLALMSGGVRATSVRSFGGELGSNHRGFALGVALPAAGDLAPQ